MKADDLINAFYKANYQRYELVAPNVYPCWRFKEMDITGIRKSGFIDEIEVKLSRSDFLADFKKTVSIKCKPYFDPEKTYNVHREEKLKHECIPKGLNHCNYFSFLIPIELQDKCDIPEYAGLYVFDGRFVRELKKPPRLHKRKISDKLKYDIARKLAFRFWEYRKQI